MKGTALGSIGQFARINLTRQAKTVPGADRVVMPMKRMERMERGLAWQARGDLEPGTHTQFR
jgi:hypothetical protein